jgi:hypothetical protein
MAPNKSCVHSQSIPKPNLAQYNGTQKSCETKGLFGSTYLSLSTGISTSETFWESLL